MMGSAIQAASMGTWFEGPWAGFGWGIRDAAGGIGQSAVGSGGWQSGHVPGGSYISNSVFAGVYENTNLRARQINIESFDCDTSPGHPNSGYTYSTSVALPTQVVPTIALGGANIDAAQGSFSWPGAAGNVVVSGLGFRPQLVILVWSKTDTYNRGYTFGDANGASAGIGAASSAAAGEQWAFYGMEPGDSAGYTTHQTGKIAVCHNGAAVLATAVLASMDAGGFTLTFSGPDTGEALSVVPRLVGWIALRDSLGGFKVGNAVVPGSGGNVAYSGCGFQPDQVIVAHGNAASANSVLYGGSWGVGFFDALLQASFVSGPNLTVFPGYGAHRMSLASAIQFGANNAASVDGEATRTSIDSDGFTLNWTNTAAAGKPWGWIAMKTTGGNRPCGGPAYLPQIYRRL
jgi:hypothetical protein